MSGTQYNDQGFGSLWDPGPQTQDDYLSHPTIRPGSTVWDYQLAVEGVVEDEVIATGDGIETAFSGTFSWTPILSNGSNPYQVTVTTLVSGNPVQVADDGDGVFTGNGTGTLDEETGGWAITWDDPPDDDVDMLAGYIYRNGTTSPTAVDDGNGSIVGTGLAGTSSIVYETGYAILQFTAWVECAGNYPCAAAIVDYFGDFIALTKEIVFLNKITAAKDIALLNVLSVSKEIAFRNQLHGETIREIAFLNRLSQTYFRDIAFLTALAGASSEIIRDIAFFNALLPQEAAIQNTWDVKLDGISIKDQVGFPLSITMNGESHSNEAQLVVNDMTLLDAFKEQLRNGEDVLIITIQADEFRFMVEEIQSAEQGVSRKISVWGLSRTGRLGNRAYTRPITKIWDDPILASAAVAELAPGYTIQFQLTDWVIPANVLSAENEMPLDLIKRIAAAQGGIVRSGRAGELILRPAYPVDLARLSAETPDRVVSHLLEILSSGGQVIRSEGYNAVLVEGKESALDRTLAILELDEDRNDGRRSFLPGENAFVRVYTSPLGVSYADQVTLGTALFLGAYEATIAERRIRVSDGRASLPYPIKSLTLLDWEGRSLSGGTWSQGGMEILFNVAEGCSGSAMLLVSYTTQYDLWRVTSAIEGEAILCLEDDQG